MAIEELITPDFIDFLESDIEDQEYFMSGCKKLSDERSFQQASRIKWISQELIEKVKVIPDPEAAVWDLSGKMLALAGKAKNEKTQTMFMDAYYYTAWLNNLIQGLYEEAANLIDE